MRVMAGCWLLTDYNVMKPCMQPYTMSITVDLSNDDNKLGWECNLVGCCSAPVIARWWVRCGTFYSFKCRLRPKTVSCRPPYLNSTSACKMLCSWQHRMRRTAMAVWETETDGSQPEAWRWHLPAVSSPAANLPVVDKT